jgi:hypothetical protein
MQSEDRPIQFATELVHAPAQLAVPGLQKLYFELSQDSRLAYAGSDFNPPGPPKFVSRRGQRTRSLAVFLPDRALLVEEWVDMPLGSFIEKMTAFTDHYLPSRGVPQLTAHTFTIRTTLALSQYADANAFILEGVCRQEGRMAGFFTRPVDVAGMRLSFPPTPEEPGVMQVGVEAFKESPGEILVESKGVYAGVQVGPGDTSPLVDNALAVRALIDDAIVPYLNQFDV